MAINILQEKHTLIEVDVEDIYKAIKQNGFDHVREQWFYGDNGACVLGQGAMNLGVAVSSDVWYDFEVSREDGAEDIYELWHDYNLLVQLNHLRIPQDSKWGYGESGKIGSTIVYWNDKRVLDDDGNAITDEYDNYLYELPTYEAVTEMVYDILSPHFGKKLTLLTHEYAKP